MFPAGSPARAGVGVDTAAGVLVAFAPQRRLPDPDQNRPFFERRRSIDRAGPSPALTLNGLDCGPQVWPFGWFRRTRRAGGTRPSRKDIERELELPHAAARCGGVRPVLLRPAAARLVTCRSSSTRRWRRRPRTTASVVVPISPTAPDRRPQRRRACRQLLAHTLRSPPSKGRRPSRRHRRAGTGHRHPTARPQALQAPGRGQETSESLPIRSRPKDEEVGPLHRAALPLSRRRDQGAAVPQLSARRDGEPPDRLHRPHQHAEKAAIDETEAERPTTAAPNIGKPGVEQSYEAELHGATGSEEIETTAGGRAVRRLAEQRRDAGQQGHAGDRHPAAGARRAALRRPARRAGGDRSRSGEIPAFVSKPNFDPNLFVDGIDADNWKALNESPDKPLLNRSCAAPTRRASTYKPLMALAALTLGKRTPQQAISDPGYFWFGATTSSATTRSSATARWTCTSRSFSRATPTTTRSPTTLGVDAMHDFMEAVSASASRDRDRHRRRSAARRRRLREEGRLQAQGAAEVVRRRDDLAGIGQGYNAFTMLQMRRPPPWLPPAASATPRPVREIDLETRQQCRVSGRGALESCCS